MEEQVAPSYEVRRLTRHDAAQIPALVTAVNGPSYIHPEIYHPDQIVELNRSKRLLSVVALYGEAQVVGHCALERPRLELVPEIGEAMVLAEHRHHHLLDRMRDELEAEARGEGLFGIFGNAVTHHVFSQKSEERAGGVPIGLLMGASPAAAHRINLPQRVTLLTYLKLLGERPPMTAYPPARHRELLGAIYQRCARPVTFGRPAEPGPGAGRIATHIDPAMGRGTLIVLEIGSGTAEQIGAARDDMTEAEAVYAQIPLSNPAAASLCDNLERRGFFFGGIAPGEPARGDFILMEFLRAPLDPALIQADSAPARELLAYVSGERARAVAATPKPAPA